MASIELAKLSQHHGQSHNMASIELTKPSQHHLDHSHKKDNAKLARPSQQHHSHSHNTADIELTKTSLHHYIYIYACPKHLFMFVPTIYGPIALIQP